jgi:Protein of unknown function (DUF3149)
MQLWKDLLSTDYGLMSVVAIVITLMIAGYFSHYVSKHIREDGERYDREHGKS